MICAVHALIGAALGKSLKNRKRAFLAGVVSHFLADLVPHRDFTVKTEAVLAVSAVALVGAIKGWDSAEFWGAVGGAAPDLENAVSQTLDTNTNIFPSHIGLHGPKIESVSSQVLVALCCLTLLMGKDSPAPQQQELPAPAAEPASL